MKLARDLSISSSPLRRIVTGGGGGGGGFDPATLSPTLWLDPSDEASLFQDSAGSTPITASGQNVGRMADLSGNARHFTQGMPNAKPLYQVSGALSFVLADGSDDYLQTAATVADVLGFGAYEIVVACRFITAAQATISSWLRPAIIADAGSYINIHASNDATLTPVSAVGHFSYESSDVKARTAYTVGNDVVINARSNGSTIYISTNGGSETSVASTGPSGTAAVLRLFTSGGNYCNSRLYVLLAFSRELSAQERADAITWAGVRAGLTI